MTVGLSSLNILQEGGRVSSEIYMQNMHQPLSVKKYRSIKNHTAFFLAQQVEFFSLIFKESLPVSYYRVQGRMKNVRTEHPGKEGA